MFGRLIPLAVVLGLLTGCSGSGSKTEVSGTVTLDGAPLADAQVQLVPKTDSSLGIHVGKTNSAGQFTITQAAANTPIKAGSYVLLVSKMSAHDPNAPGGGMGSQKSLVPEVYEDRSKTPLTAEVREGNNVLEPFALVTTKK